jgi:hypothetical protein
MATYYFLNTDNDGDPANTNNWWDAPTGGTNGHDPLTTDDIVVLAEMGGLGITVNNMTIEANFNGLAIVLGVCTIQNGGYFGDGGTINGNVICSTNAYIGINGDGGTINGDLTFQNNGSTDTITSCTVNGNLYFASNWTGSASYISVSSNVIYVYGYSGAASNLTLSGATYYSNYPTLYWNNAAMDNDWSNLNNWWVDASCTQKSYEYATSTRDVEMLAGIYSPGGTAECNNLNVTNGSSVVLGLTVYGTATFNDTSYFGSPAVSITMSVSNAVMNDSSNTQSSATINVSGTMTFNDSSYNSGTIDSGLAGNVVVVYPVNRNTFNSGSIIGTNPISYNSYPAYFYFYGGNSWHNLNDWYIDSGHSINSLYIPGALDNVYIESDQYGTATDTYAANATINSDFANIAGSSPAQSYTFYITGTLTVLGSSQIGTSMNYANIVANNAIFNDTSSIYGAYLTTTAEIDFKDSSNLGNGMQSSYITSGNPGVRFYDTSTFSNGIITGDITIVSPHDLPFTIGGSYSGSLYYSGYSSRTVYFYSESSTDWSTSSNWWSDSAHTTQTYAPIPAASLDEVIVESTVLSNTNSLDSTIGNLIVRNDADISINITCTTALFEDTSSFGNNNTSSVLDQNLGTTSITFSELSSNHGYITVNDTGAGTPAVVFEDGASNIGYIDGNVEVYYPVSVPIGNINFITGTVIYFNYPLYFNDSNNLDSNWSTSTNWFLDSANTLAAGSPPTETYPGVNVILQTSVSTYTGGTPTAYDLSFGNTLLNIAGISITVNGLATFEQGCNMSSSATIYGDAKFKNTGYNSGGTITGSATFDLEAAEVMILNGYDGNYTGGEITFEYGKGVNGSSILGIV